MEINTELNKIFREVFQNPDMEITDSLCADDVGDWTSLVHFQLLSSIEEKFNIRFTTRDIKKMKCVGDLRKTIIQKLEPVIGESNGK